MNKEYKYLNNKTIEIKDTIDNLKIRKVNSNNPTETLELENKIEILNSIIEKTNKKVNNQKEFLKIAALWIKVHLTVPTITILFLILSCVIGWIYTIYPLILASCRLSLAIIFTSIIIGIVMCLTNKDINGLTSKLESTKEMKNDLEKQLLIKLSEEHELSKINQNELNQSIKLKENLSLAEEKVLSYAYSEGFHKKTKRLVKSKSTENNFTR